MVFQLTNHPLMPWLSWNYWHEWYRLACQICDFRNLKKETWCQSIIKAITHVTFTPYQLLIIYSTYMFHNLCSEISFLYSLQGFCLIWKLCTEILYKVWKEESEFPLVSWWIMGMTFIIDIAGNLAIPIPNHSLCWTHVACQII